MPALPQDGLVLILSYLIFVFLQDNGQPNRTINPTETIVCSMYVFRNKMRFLPDIEWQLNECTEFTYSNFDPFYG